MKHCCSFSFSYPFAWKSGDFYTVLLRNCWSFLNSWPLDGIGLNTHLIAHRHLEMLRWLWLFIRRKTSGRVSAPSERFGIVRDSITEIYYPDYVGNLWSVCASCYLRGQIVLAWKNSISSHIGLEDTFS